MNGKSSHTEDDERLLHTEKHTMYLVKHFSERGTDTYKFADACLSKLNGIHRYWVKDSSIVDREFVIQSYNDYHNLYNSSGNIRHLGSLYAICVIYEQFFGCPLGEDVNNYNGGLFVI